MIYCFAFLLLFCIILFISLWVSSGKKYLKQEDKKKATNEALTFAFCNIVGLIGLLVILQQWFLFTSPATVFKKSFKFTPPEDVTLLDCSFWYIGENGHTYLSFIAEKKTIAKIIERRKLSTRSEGKIDLEIDGSPSWWQPKKNSILYFMMRNSPDEDQAQKEYLYYDEKSKEAFYGIVIASKS